MDKHDPTEWGLAMVRVALDALEPVEDDEE
ncbi:Uncharacterised protein [Klebsiella pneumoniae]|nr:Uncharacterised protein [Klebsiella pneumoniae]